MVDKQAKHSALSSSLLLSEMVAKLQKIQNHYTNKYRKPSGSVVECLTRDRGASPGVTTSCPRARHINPSLVLVQPRKSHPYITERLFTGRKESNQKQMTKY